MVGDKDQERVRVGILAVLLDSSQLLLIRSTGEKSFNAAYEEHLERRHQGGGAGTVEDFAQVGFGKIEVEQAEIAQIAGHQVLENGFAEALAKEDFIADENVGGPKLLFFHLGDEALSLGERFHQKPSSTLLTKVWAKSRESRPMAGESS